MQFYWPIRVYYEDTDAEGVVYYANYLKFFERARTEWLRACGVDLLAMQQRDALIFVVTSAQINYRRPARLNDELLIEVNVHSARAASITFEQRAVLAADREELCTASISVACVSHETFSPRRVPAWVREKITCATN